MLLIGGFSINAQNYTTAVGVRGGLFNGITLKQFVGEYTAFEGIVYSRWNGIGATVLLEHHNDLLDMDELKWYFGYGAHVGFYSSEHVAWAENKSFMNLGADGILGVEYVFSDLPISLSIDWKPYFNLIGYTGLFLDGGGLSVRYTF
jgi:hypothetical protein